MPADTLQFKKIAVENVHACPLCGMPQEGMVNGTRIENGQYILNKDKWYAFCNCHNIFFTDWRNMEQVVYNKMYQDKYNNDQFQENIKAFACEIFDRIPKKSGQFLEIGVAYDTIMDEAKRRGYNPQGLDINKDIISKHPVVIGDVEDKDTLSLFDTLDVIWCAHVIEHVKNPIGLVKSLYNMLSSDGVLYVAMPDPWFIPWENPHLWAHWHYREHHIMWDMDSFIDMATDQGFRLHSATRRAITTDYQIVLQKG